MGVIEGREKRIMVIEVSLRRCLPVAVVYLHCKSMEAVTFMQAVSKLPGNNLTVDSVIRNTKILRLCQKVEKTTVVWRFL